MELYLIRHGQSTNNLLATMAGRSCDPPLTETGQRQAELVGEYLSSAPAKCLYGRDGIQEGFGLSRLYCSAHLRCLQTATRIAEQVGLDPEIWMDVHEEMGIWQEDGENLPGLAPAEIRQRFPMAKIPADMNEAGWWNRPRETEEEWIARASRVARVLRQDMAASHERIGIVTHGGFTKDLLAALVSDGPVAGVSFSTQNTSIGRIDFGAEGCQVRYLNRLEHLPPELVT